MDLAQLEVFRSLPSQSLTSECSRKTGFLDDHLLLPTNRAYDAVEVPYLCAGIVYDDGSILTYHRRRGWTDAQVHDPKTTGKTDVEIGEFFQNWLFFGLLSGVLGTHIAPGDFVQENEYGRSVLTTKSLPDYIMRWCKRERKCLPSVQTQHAERAKNSLYYASHLMSDWSRHGTSPMDDWTALYLIMLGEYLEDMLRYVFFNIAEFRDSSQRYSSDPLQTFTGLDILSRLSSKKRAAFDFSQVNYLSAWYGTNRGWPPLGRNNLRAQMAKSGWCPSDVQRLSSTLMLYGVYAASMLKPPDYKNEVGNPADEKASISGKTAHARALNESPTRTEHRLCSESRCQAYELREKEYETKHVSKSCVCNHLEVKTSTVINILGKGQIPLVQVGRGVHIVPAESGSQYVAISHVWSDGLGNPRANAIPACQLIRLAVQCKALFFPSGSSGCWWEEPVLIWVDTLCCPVKEKEARAQAMSLMAKTYEYAHRVLVIESSLISRSIATSGAMELLVAIFCSKWHRRLWCLLERLLGKSHIRYQFKDGAISSMGAVLRVSPAIEGGPLKGLPGVGSSLFDLTRSESIRYHTVSHSLIIQAILGDENTLAYMQVPSGAMVSKLQSLLSFRSTSKPADEALCLSILIGLHPKKILDAPNDPDSRMETLWSMMEQIPPEVIFWIGPKLSRKGYRGAQ
ncbi:hypothetical protein K431DRAFT_350225 [Polychaeton citri CBS 116435]|uniref:Heterokaryon incompatibility domain-containing protein n=1 Tax=Polychaeton citri CBS 116435 TaxID=1314669 RepID=A0A9P4PZE8_9PEZI|nr:hypothetical protein K431DRAFT_350225 [Polychaeton citri CBS 116435]